MSLISFIQNIVHHPQVQQQAQSQNYNRVIHIPSKSPSGDYQFTPSELPVAPRKFEIKLPQNVNPLQGFNIYGDSSGNRWFENEKTGMKIPIPSPKIQYDAPVPQLYPNFLMPGQGPPQVQIPIQYHTPTIPKGILI